MHIIDLYRSIYNVCMSNYILMKILALYNYFSICISAPSPPYLLRILLTSLRDSECIVELNWLPPINPNGVITHYKIEYSTNSDFTRINGTGLTQNNLTYYNWTITDLEFSTYYIRVRAVNSANNDTSKYLVSEPSNVIKKCLENKTCTGKAVRL